MQLYIIVHITNNIVFFDRNLNFIQEVTLFTLVHLSILSDKQQTAFAYQVAVLSLWYPLHGTAWSQVQAIGTFAFLILPCWQLQQLIALNVFWIWMKVI